MLWLPTLRALVLKLALPSVSDKISIGVGPSSKTTVPVGVSELTPSGVTVAVKVTSSPNTDGFGEDFTATTDAPPGATFATNAFVPPATLPKGDVGCAA